MSDNLSFVYGIIFGGVMVGLFMMIIIWLVSYYKRHPELLNEDDNIDIE